MSGLTPIYFNAASNVFVCLNMDKTIYDADVAAAVGGSVTEPPANSIVFFLDQKAARKSGAVGRIVLGCKRGTKRRQVPLICDKDKLATVATALKDKKVKLGIGAGVEWDILTVRGA
jgi:hypothetical protein